MKIAIIGSHGYPYVYGGFETLVTELSERLTGQGVDVTVYCRRHVFRHRPAVVNGIRLVYVPTIDMKQLAQIVHSFLSMVHACFSSVDVILVLNPANGPFGLIARLMRKRTAINVDGLEWLRPKWAGLGSVYFRMASWCAARWFDTVVCDSTEMQKVYHTMYRTESVGIAYGADVEVSRAPELIRKWGLTPRQYFLVVGRLVPDNNSDTIVREYLTVATDKKLVIVGDAIYEDDFSRRLKKFGGDRVLFTGYVTDQKELSELYLNCFAYLHGHEFGGTNPTMLKALGCGCAIAALDTVFTREMLADGEFGTFFTKQAGSLGGVLARLIDDGEAVAAMRRLSPRRVLEHYSWADVTNKYKAVFDALLARR